MSEILLEIGNLKTYYFTHGSVIKAVDDVSLGIYKREMVGLVGESGSGKSTLGLSIIKLVPPPGKIVDGKITIDGEDILKLRDKELRRIRGKKIGMIFQDPLTCLDPLRRVGDQIVESIMSHIKVDKETAREMALKVFERVGISPERIDDYPHQLSGGMRQRAMIAMAVVLNPELLIADEPTTALDVVVQSRIMDLLEDLKNERKMSILLITHDLALVIERCDRVVIMYAGKICEIGSVKEISNEPLHPYTKLLIESIPNIEGTQMELKPIPGTPPDMRNPPLGCRFWPRCPYALDKCKSVEPKVLEIDNRVVFCHLYGG
ncbi:MAG: ABC transporter ATP-binding protein [Thaumarchaeota archaeon]|jgi:peptide/nickel transport system ATP-binding protein|nr:ABC transporter ATP-binding protein [Candidatus Geocrenenecus arthurdayi]MCL7391548.1 ABC transporter ATP-binding protein [Candidatus Geocrenenecus arthurdayi]MCL7396970.1 ABC transporter ATP-binding protein [Candidatus Geocrenenecus arthurdayi]MCL7403673.1 ABC transporter ATP-binding protein [Candidatus Geocrenenecus arthurdayi]